MNLRYSIASFSFYKNGKIHEEQEEIYDASCSFDSLKRKYENRHRVPISLSVSHHVREIDRVEHKYFGRIIHFTDGTPPLFFSYMSNIKIYE